MPGLQLTEQPGRLVLRSPVSTGLRLFLCGVGSAPLVAPYELLVAADRPDPAGPFWYLSAFIAVAATALSGFIWFVALAGLDSEMVFDAPTATFRYTSHAPLLPRRTLVRPLSAIRGVEIGCREWSDGAPTYHLRVTLAGEAGLTLGATSSHEEATQVERQVVRFLAGAGRTGGDWLH